MATPTPSTDPAELQVQAAKNWEQAKAADLLAQFRKERAAKELAMFRAKKEADKPTDPAVALDPLQLTQVPIVRDWAGDVATGARKTMQAIPATAEAAGQAALGAAEIVGAPFGLTKPERAQSAIQAVKDDPGMLQRGVEQALGPTGQFVVGALGGDPTQATPPTGKQVREDIGSIGMAELLGKVVPEVSLRVARRIPMSLPGASVEEHALAAQRMEGLVEGLRPSAAAKAQAYQDLQAAMGGQLPRFSMGNFRRTLSDLISDEYKKLPAEQDGEWIAYLKQHLDDTAEGVEFESIKPTAESIGARIGGFHSTQAGATARGTTQSPQRILNAHLNKMLAAIDTDVEAGVPAVVVQPAIPPAPMTSYFGGPMSNPQTGQPIMSPGQPAVIGTGTPTAQTLEVHPLWKAASRLYRRDMAATGLARDVQTAIGVAGDGWTSIGGLNRLINKIVSAQKLARLGNKSERLWVNSFEPGELNKIVSELRSLRREVPALTKGRGVITGTSQRFPRAVIGGAAGEAVGAREIGAAIGLAIPELIAQAMMSEPGRALVRAATRMDPTIGPVFQNTLAAFLRTQVKPEVFPGLQQPQRQQAQQPQPAPAPQPSPTPAPTPQFDEAAFQKWKGNYADTGATEPELRQTFQAGLSPSKEGVGGPWVPPNVLKNARTEPLGKVLDYWRQLTNSQKQQLRPILMTRLLRGQLLPADRDQLRAALMPNSLPEEAPTH